MHEPIRHTLQPLITRLHVSNGPKQCWFANDATASGSLKDVRKWWEELSESGPPLGYFPNAKKCLLIIKPEREQAAREAFRDTAINVTTEGHKHLGAALGSRSFLEEYDGERVDEWVNEVTKLADFAISQPQACYAAFTFHFTSLFPLVRRIAEQEHQPSVALEIQTLQLSTRKQRDDCLSERLEQVKNSLPTKAKRAVELATEKGSSNWLTVIPLKELDYNLNKKGFRDAIKLRHDWEITDTPMFYACGVY